MSKKIPIRPNGHYVLVEDEPIEEISAGGIVLATATERRREETGQDYGRVRAFGPIAFKDVKGCQGPEDWGVKIGDLVEYTGRYEGKESAFVREGKVGDETLKLRLIPDLSIVSTLIEE